MILKLNDSISDGTTFVISTIIYPLSRVPSIVLRTAFDELVNVKFDLPSLTPDAVIPESRQRWDIRNPEKTTNHWIPDHGSTVSGLTIVAALGLYCETEIPLFFWSNPMLPDTYTSFFAS
jgi:hypothetical protein